MRTQHQYDLKKNGHNGGAIVCEMGSIIIYYIIKCNGKKKRVHKKNEMSGDIDSRLCAEVKCLKQSKLCLMGN